MRWLLLLLAFVLGARSVILDYNVDETFVEEDVAFKENEEQQQLPVGRTLFLLQLLKDKLNKLHQSKQVPNFPAYTGCICVHFYLCIANGTLITDGSGVIDFRQSRPCPNAAEVCCYVRGTNPAPPPTAPMTNPTLPTTPAPTTKPTTAPPIIIVVPGPTAPPPTLPTTKAPATQPPPQQFCICIPIFQCALNSGIVVTGAPTTGIIDPRQQLASTCTGIFVCCPNAVSQPTMAPTTLPPFTLAPTTLPTTTTTMATTTTTMRTTTLLPSFNFNLNCLCVLLTACGLGYMPLSNMNSLDPRQLVPRQGQSCSGTNSVCCRLGSGRGDQVVQSNALVKFDDETIKNPGSPNACRCVPVDNCPESDTVSYDSNGTIDPRFGPCMSPTLVCCKLQAANIHRQSDIAVSDLASRANVANCGIRDTTFAAVTSSTAGSAHFAEFPWMVLLLTRRAGSADTFQCGGSLINSRIVLTAAHCVVTCDPGTLIARVGEWNTTAAMEPFPSQDIGVQTVIAHPQFHQNALYHDVALIVLKSPVTYAINVRPVCLAAENQQFAANTVCYASGWGSSAFGPQGQYQTILRKVSLPIVDNDSCQTRLRATRLGGSFQLHPSFICAGGQPNMDTCYKDGGGPLVCQDSSGRFIQAGIVSWGIGCGSATPAVYASVAQHRQWIDQQVSALGITT